MSIRKNILTSQVIEDAAQGDQKAFRILYNEISGVMYSLCIRYAENSDDASDSFQEGMMKLYGKLPTFRHEGSFEGWARRIFVTTALDQLKKKIRVSELDKEDEEGSEKDSYYEKSDLHTIIIAIQNLTPQMRSIVNLSLVEGYSHKEISELLGISVSASKSTLSRGRQILSNNLKQES